jgi:hypothetical protein
MTDSDLHGGSTTDTKDMHGLGSEPLSSGLVHFVDRGGKHKFTGVRFDGDQLANVFGFQRDFSVWS